MIGEIAKDVQSQLFRQVQREINDVDEQHRRELEIESKELLKLKEALASAERESKVIAEKRVTVSNEVKALVT